MDIQNTFMSTPPEVNNVTKQPKTPIAEIRISDHEPHFIINYNYTLQ